MSEPLMPPMPPERLAPPITTAAITSSSLPTAVVGSPTVSRAYCMTPARPANKPDSA